MILAGSLAYWPTLENGFLNLDDRLFVVDNPLIPGGLTAESLKWALTADVFEDSESVDYWQPATLVSRLIDGSLHGLNPAGHHLTNLLLHLANAVLVLLLLAGATGRLWRSAVVALVFATHPIHVSSVAWVAERKDVLSAFFSLISLAIFARFATLYRAHLDGGVAGRTGVRVVRWYLLLAAGYALCLMSKPMTLPLPFVMLLVAVWPIPRERRPALGRLALCLTPLLSLSAGAVFLYTRVHTASAELDQLVVQSPLLIAGRVVMSAAAYPVRLLWPANLQHIYSVHPGSVTTAAVAWSLLLLAAITGVAVAGARRHPFLPVGWLWYLVSLLPATTAFLTSAAADRFSYFALLGVTAMIVWGVAETTGSRLATTRAIASAAIVVALILTTRAESRHWKNSETLFSHLLGLDPNHDIGQRNLGVTLAEVGKHEEALVLFQAALAARPDSPTSYHNMGVVLEKLGWTDEALRHYAQAVRLDPSYHASHFNMGLIYENRGELDKALACFHEMLRTRPRAAGALREVGYVHSLQGRSDLAADYYQRALEIDPGSTLLMNELGAELLKLGQADRATALFRRVLAFDPGDRSAREHLRSLGEAADGPGVRGPVKR